MKTLKQNGFSHVVIVLVVVVIAVIVLAAARVMSNHMKQQNAAVTPPAQSSAAQPIKTKADVQQAGKSLDNEKIDQNLNPDQLNADLNSIY